MEASAATKTPRIALVGNPNCGKTALFNLLTGSRQKVANYAGVTVERKEGLCQSPSGKHFPILDLPGAYSLDATSPDEAVTRDVLWGNYPGETSPDVLLCVVDASNLQLHLRFVLELMRVNKAMIVVVNMVDAAARQGIHVDCQALAAQLGVPVVETVAIKRGGGAALMHLLQTHAWQRPSRSWGGDVDARHQQVKQILDHCLSYSGDPGSVDDKLDTVFLHPIAGMAILAALLFMMFQAVFAWATPAMDIISASLEAVSGIANTLLPGNSPLSSLLNDGVIAGLGNVLIFLPQILILFLFILILEESGYLPRAAYLLDRLMFRAGLSGRSFIPLLSSFACAIPGIMATRSIQDPRDRLTTILVAPLMTCSARLPVYTMLIAAFIPQQQVAGIFNLQGLVLFSLYFGGIISALIVAYVMKWLRRDKREHALLMELPSYRLPNLRDLGMGLLQRAKIFLRRVGGIIFALTILLWAMCSFPSPPMGATGPAIDYSIAGLLGHALANVFEPIGFNWQISVALIPGMAAREVAVSALGTVYAMSGSEEAISQQLGHVISQQWSLPTALSLLAWFVFAPQCLSTLAIIRRETNSWKVMGFAMTYLFALAYVSSLIVYQIASAIWL